MAKYRKKPVVIDAVQWTGDNLKEMHAFMNAARLSWRPDPDGNLLFIRTLEGEMQADKLDWVIKGVKGEFYPCKPDIFAATYEAVEEV